jgi:hypothetical protein
MESQTSNRLAKVQQKTSKRPATAQQNRPATNQQQIRVIIIHHKQHDKINNNN